eukprot:Lankesteria_metandrocarpae@DN536_c0_g1_i1.p1
MIQVADLQQEFGVCCRLIFSNWTLLRLAVEHGWGGRDGLCKAEGLAEDVISILAHRKVSVHDLADALTDRLLTEFSTEAEDDSPEEVANILLKLRDSLAEGDLAVAQQVRALNPITSAQCIAGRGAHDSSSSSSSSESGSSSGESEVQEPEDSHDGGSSQTPVDDDDGWTTVTKTARQRRS